MPRARSPVHVLAALLLAAGAGAAEPRPAEQAPPAGWPRTLVDDLGRSLTLARPPRRVVSTAPSNTEALFALGAGDRVVGVTTYCVYPEEAKTREKVGDFSSVDFEKVLALRPDLVVATGLEQRRHVTKMESLGLPVFVVFPSGIDGTLRSLASLGRALGEEEKARALVGSLERRLAAVDARVAAIPEERRPRVFLEIGRSPLYTAGPGSTVDEALRRAGGRNVAADLGKGYAPFAREAVMARDPDVVVVLTGDRDGKGKAAFAAEPGFARLSAVRRGAVHDSIDPDLLVHENHRLVDGIEALLSLLHGEPAPVAGAASLPAGDR